MLNSISNKPINDNAPPITGFVKNNKNFVMYNSCFVQFRTKLIIKFANLSFLM